MDTMRNDKSLFLIRTSKYWHNQKARARAKGLTLTYGVEQVRTAVTLALANHGRCPYCTEKLTPANFTLDHLTPVSRGGSWELGNTIVCCMQCNQLKDNLDKDEFLRLCSLVSGWPAKVQADFWSRLKSGGGRFRRG